MKHSTALHSFALLALFCGNILAQTAPKLLPFQGRLTDQNGTAVSNGVRLVQFKIYDVPTGGSPVWAGELHRTTVNGGLVNVMLGSKTPFTGVDFDKQLYLEITVDINADSAITLADPPMLPRQVILPVVFAKEAAYSRDGDKLDGYDWAALFGTNNPADGTLLDSKIRDGSVSATKIIPSSITSNQIAPQNINASLIKNSTITSNQIALAAIDVSNLAQQVAEALNPPGTVIAYAGGVVPSGWLLCDGSPISRTTFPRLYAAISTAWGPGDNSTTFHLPDLRGLFLRGVNGGRPADGYQDPGDNRVALKPGGATGNSVGSYQADALQGHFHNVRKSGDDSFGIAASEANAGEGPYGFAYGTINQDNGHSFLAKGLRNDGVHGIPRTASETRSGNAYVNYIIKY